MKKEPAIRFEEFADAWEQCAATDIFSAVSDKGYSDLPVLSASQELGMIRRNEIGIDIKYDEKSTKNYKRVKPGQFVIHLRSFQGGFAWSEVEGITSPAYTILDFKEPEKQVSKFWKEVLTSSTFIKRLETVTYGIRDGRSISYTDFSTLKFSFPSVKEQIKIGSFFQQLDNNITIQQRKLDLLKEQKKGFLQKMFPKNGETVPELRFEGFADAWEQRELGEVISEFSVKSKYENEYITLSSTNSGMEKRDGRVSGSSNIGYKIIDNGDLVLSPQNLWLGNININDIGKGLVSPSYKTFKFKNVISDFIKPQLRSKRMLEEYKNSSTQGASVVRRNLDADLFNQIRILVPSTNEQQAIGSLFSNLDQTIAFQQRKLEILKTMKKTLLNLMFI